MYKNVSAMQTLPVYVQSIKYYNPWLAMYIFMLKYVVVKSKRSLCLHRVPEDKFESPKVESSERLNMITC